ncbi:MAG: outer membrane beta-barrel protein [Methylobacillus sp.]|jgi:outer membrane protein|nr:outer membrane beta-barrel protein [Methylobacillus sp.]
MKKTLLAVLIASAFAPAFAMAEEGDFVVRLRATHIQADEDSSLGKKTNNAWGGGAPNSVLNQGAELAVESNTIPEIDFSYYVTKNIALELILAVGTRHDVKIHKNGNVGQLVPGKHNLGSVNALPPTLTVQWHFRPDQVFDPYVGAGINYTLFMDKKLKLDAANAPIRIERDSWGPALQAGFDVNFKDGWLVNADVKKIWMNTDVKMNVGGAGYRKIDDLDIDPWVISVGFGKKF